MQDNDIHIVIRLVKKSIQQWPVPFMDRLTKDGADPFKVLIACILSLRTRDQTADEASKRLFALSADPFSMAQLDVGLIEKAIVPVGFYRTKSKQIRGLSRQICQEFQGVVPDALDNLLQLSGVGRKTANLVRTLGYSKPGICVDIHVHRICNRLGYVETASANETEDVLRKKLPKKYWVRFNPVFVTFGQNQCTPISPRCRSCQVSSFCPKVGVLSSR